MIWVPLTGAFFPEAWYPSAAAAWLILLITVLGSGRLLPASPAARTALLAFAGLVGLNYLSMLWAQSPASALTASNQLMLYLAVAWTFAILPWTPTSLATLIGAWALAVAAFCAVDLVRALSTSSLSSFFSDYRYATPLEYPNATAALALTGMWPSLILSSRRELPTWARAALVAVAAFLLEFSFLPQSRGAVVALIVSIPVVLALVRGRVALTLRLALLGVGLAAALPSILGVTHVIDQNHPAGPALSDAAMAMLITTSVTLVAAGGLAGIEARWRTRTGAGSARPPARDRWAGRRPSRRQLATAVVAGLAVVGVIAAVVVPKVVHQGQTDTQPGTTRLLSITPEERLDYFRVAVDLFAGSPLIGVGSGNFGRRYDALRHFPQHSQYVHDLPLRVLSETGLVGLLLLITLVVAVLMGLNGAIRSGGWGRAAAVSSLAIAAIFVIEASFDWIDQFPALAAPALALPLAAAEMGGFARVAGPGSGSKSRSAIARRPARMASRSAFLRPAGMLIATALVALAVVPAYLALRGTDRALRVAPTQPREAYRQLESAASLNPLSADPLLAEGTIALKHHDWSLAGAAFRRADRREQLWYAHLQLALLDARKGNYVASRAELSTAAALDRDDAVIDSALDLVLRRAPIDPNRFDRQLLEGAESAIYRPEHIR